MDPHHPPPLAATCQRGVTARVTIDASKSLAVFAFYGLGVGKRKADLAIEPGETCPPADVRRARDSTISRQLGLLAHGRFSEAGAIAARRAASERSAAASGDEPAPAAEGEDNGGSEQLSASTIRAVHLQCALGNPGKGAGRLETTPAAAFCGTTFTILLELHPPARHAILAALMSVVVEPVKATTEALVAVLGKLRRGVAAGCSGLTNDHLRSLFPVDTEPEQEALGPLLRFVNKALAADMDEETADWLCASVLVALYKPDGEGGLKRRASDGLLDVRPIAIPETLYRLVALCGLHMCKADITAKLTEIKQLGVGVSSGCEAIAAAVRLHIDEVLAGGDEVESADRLISAAVLCDASNAFNTVDRDAVLRMVWEVCPGLLPFVRMSYCRNGRLVLANRGSGAERYRVFLSQTALQRAGRLESRREGL